MKLQKKSLINHLALSAIFFLACWLYSKTFDVVNYMWLQEYNTDFTRYFFVLIYLNVLFFLISRMELQYYIFYLITLLVIYMPIGVIASNIEIDFSYFVLKT